MANLQQNSVKTLKCQNLYYDLHNMYKVYTICESVHVKLIITHVVQKYCLKYSGVQSCIKYDVNKSCDPNFG